MKRKALVAMSGGVDSSVAAYLMQQAGYEVTGVMMKLFDNSNTDNAEDAKKVADKLGAGFEVFDMRSDFREEVIDKFVAAYERGETPNPCVFCNKRLKFDALYNYGLKSLFESAQSAETDAFNKIDRGLGTDEVCNSENGSDSDKHCKNESGSSDDEVIIATGHYAVIEYDEEAGRYKLRKAANPEKDQSYVLYNLTQEQLARTMFPLGALSKDEVRRVAEAQGFVTAHKSESQDICFIPDGDYASFIRGYTGRDYPPGDFVDADGNVMGEHKGIIKYTIGQRKGLGLALKKPAYVLRLNTEGNRVILGDNEDLFTRELTAHDFNWVSMAPPSGPFRASARIRYRHREAPAEIIPLDNIKKDTGSAFAGAVKIIFDEPQRAITRGQSVVIYDGDYVLGGGIID